MEKKKVSRSRRRLLQLTGTTLGTALLSSSPVRADKVASPDQKPKPVGAPRGNSFFSPLQRQLVDELSETIIPADSHSGGAKAAKVVDTIDRILRESLDQDEKKTWLEGLKLIDVMSQRSCGKLFVEASSKQRIVVLQVLSSNLEMTELLEVRFFKALKRLTVDAYYSSKIGILEELEYKGNTVLDEFVGCKPS